MVDTLRAHLNHYSTFGHSDSLGDISCTKPNTQWTHVTQVDDKIMERLNIADAIGKTIDRLCEKGNQLDSIYASGGYSHYRVELSRKHHLEGNMLKHGLFAGNGSELEHFAEYIASAVNTDRQQQNRTEGTNHPNIPLTRITWFTHEALLLGDPRAETGLGCVIADGWGMRPAAHTLEHGLFIDDIPTVHSVTHQTPSSYLDEVLNKRDMKSVVEEYESGFFKERKMNKYPQKLSEDIRKGMGIYDVQYNDRERNTLQFYQAPGKAPRNFDRLPTEELREKERIHSEAQQQFPRPRLYQP
ncbi:hypothetical protein ACKC9G_09540 [Pokkaliibacter sp. CJK22405]|uniref:hypothetical protein n=1 Tax=Pokkaliibacter sp. CJK22405 TaxID=3384615 RepID=UPI003984ECF4